MTIFKLYLISFVFVELATFNTQTECLAVEQRLLAEDFYEPFTTMCLEFKGAENMQRRG
tara:strand:- start:347 stop:523 length:177 start_codon:yes stop_codon:yes gene_type:complete